MSVDTSDYSICYTSKSSLIMSRECKYCKKSFSTGQEYGAHLNSEHLYTCWDCDTNCIDKVTRDQHFRKHHNSHPCAICYRIFPTEDDLANHYANPNDIDPSKCDICKKTVESNKTLWDHVQNSHPLQCPIGPGYRCVHFSNKKDFDGHLSYLHHLYPCNTCHLVYRTEQQRAVHVAAAHVPCPLCKRVFVSEVEKDSHIFDTHRGIRCSVCWQVFTTNLQFNLHFNQQHVISCPHCPKNFHNDTERTEHINTVHRYQCVVCHEFLADNEASRFHYESVHRFKCSLCSDVFLSEERRTEHLASAHRVQCAVCEEFLVDNAAFQCHYDTEHRFTCFVCDRVFVRETDRDCHATTVHQVRCDVCGIQLDSVDQKVDHYNAVHQVHCELCERRCISVHELQVHYVSIHGKVYGDDECTSTAQPNDEDKSECYLCDETFPTEKLMVKHYKNSHAAQYKDNFQISK